MESDSAIDRRKVLKAGAAAAGTGLFGSIAGCQSGPSSGTTTRAGGRGRIGYVPSKAEVVFYTDVSGLLNDSGLKKGMNAILEDLSKLDGYSGATSVEEALTQAEKSSKLDPRKLSEVVAFGDIKDSQSGSSDSSSYGGVIMLTDWKEDALVSSMEQSGTSLTKEDYEGRTLYKQEEESSAQIGGSRSTSYLGVLESGTYVVGNEKAVKDVIDVRADEEDPLSGELKSVYGNTQGYIRFASDVEDANLGSSGSSSSQLNTEALKNAEYVSGSLYKQGSDRTIAISVHADSTDSAEDLKSLVDGALTMAEQQMNASTMTGEMQKQYVRDVKKALDKATVSRDGKVVTATYTDSPERVVSALLSPMLIFIINLSTMGQSRSVETGQQTDEQLTNQLRVVSTTGTVEDGEVGVVKMTVTKASGAEDVDLSTATVQWAGPSGLYNVVAKSASTAAAADGRFGVSAVADGDDSAPVLNDAADRFQLVFDVGADSVSTDDTSGTTSFGENLPEGASVSVSITTQSGGSTRTRLVVPESLTGQESVSL